MQLSIIHAYLLSTILWNSSGLHLVKLHDGFSVLALVRDPLSGYQQIEGHVVDGEWERERERAEGGGDEWSGGNVADHRHCVICHR